MQDGLRNCQLYAKLVLLYTSRAAEEHQCFVCNRIYGKRPGGPAKQVE